MRTHVSLPDDLVKDIDELVGKRKRSAFIADSIKKAVKRERLLKVINEGAGIISAEDAPHWATPEKTAQWLKELRSIPSSFERNRGRIPTRRKPADRLAKERSHR